MLYAFLSHSNIVGKMISVSIKKFGLHGVLTLYLEYFDTVKSVKEGIYTDKNMKVPPSQQQLFFNERPLDDSLTLSQCGIENGSQIVVRGINATCKGYSIMYRLMVTPFLYYICSSCSILSAAHQRVIEGFCSLPL